MTKKDKQGHPLQRLVSGGIYRIKEATTQSIQNEQEYMISVELISLTEDSRPKKAHGAKDPDLK